jgi:hypothetical protein
VSTQLQRRIDKAAVERMTKAMLDGANLRFKLQARELVISNPDKPYNGEARINYTTGQVFLKRAVWEHWGLLQGFEYNDGGGGPFVGADKILCALFGERE